MKTAVNFKARTLLVLFGQVTNKHIKMNTSIILEFLLEIPQYIVRAKCLHKKKKIDIWID